MKLKHDICKRCDRYGGMIPSDKDSGCVNGHIVAWLPSSMKDGKHWHCEHLRWVVTKESDIPEICLLDLEHLLGNQNVCSVSTSSDCI